MEKPVINFSGLAPLSSRVTRVTGKLSFGDKIGALQVRSGIHRNSYSVSPGLYAIGKPDSRSDVFVTSNYKLTFDIVRNKMEGMDAYILVLDTKGVNVWCAAGKGTFGTDELVRRIQTTSLKDIVSHKRLILPQLGAVGVAAHKVKEITGFSVIYGPVRVIDLKTFVNNGYKASPNMRRMDFPWFERLKLVPVEIAVSLKYLFIALLLMAGLSGFKEGIYSLNNILERLPVILINMLTGYLAGTFLAPLLLSVLPFRSFSAKGLVTGVLSTVILFGIGILGENVLEFIAWFLIIVSVSSFLAMNFTGASTYTSLSGVKKEMKIAIPLQISFVLAGLVMYVVSGIIKI